MTETNEKKLFKQKCVMAVMLVLIMAAFVMLQIVNTFTFDVFTGLVSTLAAVEISNLLTKMGRPNYKSVVIAYPVLVFISFVVMIMLEVEVTYVFLVGIGIMALLFVLSFVVSITLLKKDTVEDGFRVSTNMKVSQFAFYKSSNTLFGMYYPTFLFMFLYFINHITSIGFDKITVNYGAYNIGIMGIILAIGIASFSDTFANIFGRMIKGPKLCPKISPNKTISGFCFGLLGGAVCGVVTYFVFNAIFAGALTTIGFWRFMIVGFVGSAVSSVGDLLESYIKRRANVKDASNILRSHGGILDRFDSIALNIPFVFICLLMMLI